MCKTRLMIRSTGPLHLDFQDIVNVAAMASSSSNNQSQVANTTTVAQKQNSRSDNPSVTNGTASSVAARRQSVADRGSASTSTNHRGRAKSVHEISG